MDWLEGGVIIFRTLEYKGKLWFFLKSLSCLSKLLFYSSILGPVGMIPNNFFSCFPRYFPSFSIDNYIILKKMIEGG